jgi:Ca2+-binding EF-hand superfamily protein
MGAASSDLRGLAADQVISMIAEYFQQRNMTLSQAFSLLDRDNSNYVSWDEFVLGINLCLQNTGQHRVSNADLWPIFKRFDRNGDNNISLEEFQAQFYSGRRGTAGKNWYEDELRMRGQGLGGNIHYQQIGYGPPVMSPALRDSRRIDDVVSRIGSAIVRTGFTPMQLFNKVDLDHNGRLTWDELEKVILSFQSDLSVTERQSIFRRFDKDGNGSIDIQEFCNTLNTWNPSAFVSMETKLKAIGDKFRAQNQSVADAFHVFDVNWDGFLTRDEWFRAMKTYDTYGGVSLSDADIDVIFRRFDLNGDGLLSIAEFDQFFRDTLQRSYSAGGQGVYGAAPIQYGVLPTYPNYPVEQPWETEVLDLVRNCLSVGRSGMQITEVFRRLDIDHNNSMSPIEFQRMVTAYRQDLTAAHIDSLFRKVNTSGCGAITLSEFVRRFG